jgi:hypothetical protein
VLGIGSKKMMAQISPPLSIRHWTYSSQETEHLELWYRRSFTLRRRSSVIVPFQPALRMALSTVSILSHPCSGAICGRYVAVNVCLNVLRVGTKVDDERGEGADESEAVEVG